MRNPSSYLTAAEETLAMSSAQRGLGGMQRTAAAPGPNMFDSGAASKVAINNQPANNRFHQQQSMMQNMSSAVPQAQGPRHLVDGGSADLWRVGVVGRN